MYAKVIVDITREELDKEFEYRIPEELEGKLRVGTEVVVPFGRSNREINGYVVDISGECDYDPGKIKSVSNIAPKRTAIEGSLVALAAWMKEHYGGTMIQSLKTVLPVKKEGRRGTGRFVRLTVGEREAEKLLEECIGKNRKARARVIAALIDNGVLEYEFIVRKLNVTRKVLGALEERGIIAVESGRVPGNPAGEGETAGEPIVYSDEQASAIGRFCRDYDRGIRKTYLLYGVTGSGKTEVYMEMIAHALKSGKQTIVLIPEIALTYQTVTRFRKKFGFGRIAVINSRMSDSERYDQMMRAAKGDISVMIGPRSALFTPFPNLGLIIIDEEHEPTYKSGQVPRYHARETAIERARIEGASVVLGSATPSLEAFSRARSGEYGLFVLKERSKKQELPSVYAVDMREELKTGNRSIISAKLHDLIEDRLRKRQQVMLFINRRGYAGFVSCRSCGYVARCPHCDVSLTAHRGGKLVCHYCGYERRQDRVCPKCGSPHIGGFKAGTEQIEELIAAEFPGAKILRMDQDTTRNKDGYEKILETFADGEADILVGTQMIVKGHDFPNVTLVGVLAADLSLYVDDFHACERTFQLLTQAAGRAGRGTEKGEVVVQTYSPRHYAVRYAISQDYESFYREEIAYREMMGYPPVWNLMAVMASGKDERILSAACEYLKRFAARTDESGVKIMGPASPYVGKVQDVYRRVLYFKHKDYGALIGTKDRLERYIEVNPGFGSLTVQFDFNPMDLF